LTRDSIKSALHAEEQFLHGRTKLRQAGKHIRNVIHSAYKIERQAGGLKDILGELPKREASHFRSQSLDLLLPEFFVDQAVVLIKVLPISCLTSLVPPPLVFRFVNTLTTGSAFQVGDLMIGEPMIEALITFLDNVLKEERLIALSMAWSHGCIYPGRVLLVSKLASEAKKEKNTLTKEISKISNYGISFARGEVIIMGKNVNEKRRGYDDLILICGMSGWPRVFVNWHGT
ncbi:hypothetical protein CR513_27774, partial [Mucuna pruriens]